MSIRNFEVKTEENVLSSQVQRRVLIFLIVSSVGEMVTLLSLVGYWRGQRENSWTTRQQKMCYPRYKLVAGDDGNVTCPTALTNDDTKNISYCCGDISDVLNSLVKKAVPIRYDSDINPEMVYFDLNDINCTSVEHHQSLLKLTMAQEQNRNPLRLHDKLCWKKDFSPSSNFVLEYHEDDCSVLIEESGIFYIFSHLVIEVDNMTGDFDYNVEHYVNLLSDNSTGAVLLKNVMSPCKLASNDPQERTIAIGAVFRLKKGDRIFVSTSHPERIVNDHKNNYFSAYKL